MKEVTDNSYGCLDVMWESVFLYVGDTELRYSPGEQRGERTISVN